MAISEPILYDTFNFVGDSGVIASINKDAELQFKLDSLLQDKDIIAQNFTKSILSLWKSHNTQRDEIIEFKINNTVVMILTEDSIEIDDPRSPFDYWTLNKVRKLWKGISKNV